MNILHSLLQTLRQQWIPLRKSPARGRRLQSRLEPLEVRTMLAGEFTDMGSLGMAAADLGSVAWGDYDNDGDLDVVLCGDTDSTNPYSATTRLYRNNGNGSFSEIGTNFDQIVLGNVSWGDYDQDGDLDILLSGQSSSGRRTTIFRNDGNDTFTPRGFGLAEVVSGEAAFGDADADGDLDVLVTGAETTQGRITRVYRNDGTSFTNSAGLLGLYSADVAWGDYDNDGDLDIALIGRENPNFYGKIYRNDGGGSFVDISANISAVAGGDIQWGDYDNDGDLDLLLGGRTRNGNVYTSVAKVYRNDGNDTFTDIAAGLSGLNTAALAWGDYDNDGDLDILAAGSNSTSGLISRVYRNNGNNTFTDIIAGLAGVYNGAVAWGDYDNDSDIDILLMGHDATYNHRITKVYRNNAVAVNTPAPAPTNLSSTVASPTSITFSWTAPTDAQTSAAGLSYNLRVGTTSGGSEVFATMANTVTGRRRLPEAGPIQGTSYTLKNLTPGTTYYWSVQAVDTSLVGGAFSGEQTAGIPPSFTDIGSLGVTATDRGSLTWGDYDADGDLDVLVTGRDNSNQRIAKVYRRNGDGTFTDINANLAGVYLSSGAWGDFDNDGDLDILITGRNNANQPITKIYRNEGNDGFTEHIPQVNGPRSRLVDVDLGDAAWGDYDHDGDLDFAITGYNKFYLGRVVTVYTNSGNGNFFSGDNIPAPGFSVQRSTLDWGDYDNDGDLDLLVAGETQDNTLVASIYRNNGNHTFTNIDVGLNGVEWGSVSWGDADNDGDLDILLIGRHSPTEIISRVYRNDGGNLFMSVGAGLTGVFLGSAEWGDYDADGDLDILLTGRDNDQSYTKLYRNNGNMNFIDVAAGLAPLAYSSAVWGDANGDGDLDILLTGRDASSNRVMQVYINNSTTLNSKPGSPTGLTAMPISPSAVTFNWTAPTDAQTPTAGLSYNLRVGTTPGGSDVYSAMANPTLGTRRVVQAGPIQGTSYTLSGLTSGVTYYWSVQAIDTNFAGGTFAGEQSINTNTAPTLGGAIANQPVNDNATINPFSALTVTDPNTQDMFARVTILNGAVRGDFTAASTTGWIRSTSGNDIIYSRYYSPAANIGGIVQAAIRDFVFRPRTNAIQPGTTEATAFTVYVTDGSASATDNTTTVISTSVNDAPTVGNASSHVAVNDNATVHPFATLTVSDPDNQEMLARVTILNGAVRGDFTNAVSTGWTRSTLGNNIYYVRYFSPGLNVGATVQAAYRALVFQPRNNAIQPGTTELTDFRVSVSDGVAPVVGNDGTRVTTTSVSNIPAIGGAVANQTMNDNQTNAVFSTLTVADPDTQDMLARVTIANGMNRGDFTAASTSGWSRSIVGSDIVYARYFHPATNIGATVQTAIRALVFQPRTNVPVGTTETTNFTVFVNDGLANATNSTTSVITTGVAPRLAAVVPSTSMILESDVTTIIVPSAKRPAANSLARILRKSR